jgi:hypothetical protein
MILRNGPFSQANPRNRCGLCSIEEKQRTAVKFLGLVCRRSAVLLNPTR